MTADERAEFIADLVVAVHRGAPCLTDDEQRWVRQAIQIQVERAQLRRAVIEKSITSLIWLAICGLGWMFLGWATNHGYKP